MEEVEGGLVFSSRLLCCEMEEETLECVVCWQDISADDPEVECYYVDKLTRKRSVYCWTCAVMAASTHFKRWKENVDKVDCASALRRLIAKVEPKCWWTLEGDVWCNLSK